MTGMAFFQFMATVCCALFAGAAVYVNFVEHPARMECGTELRRHCVSCQLSKSGGNAGFARCLRFGILGGCLVCWSEGLVADWRRAAWVGHTLYVVRYPAHEQQTP